MGWVMASPEGIDLEGELARLQEFPVLLQLRAMDLGPSFHKSLLRPGQAASQRLDGVDREDRSLILIVRVEMGAMMLAARFHEHPE